jgi:hypothetical protein
MTEATMINDRARSAMLLLRWVLGLVILGQSAWFLFSQSAASGFAKTGLPDFVHLGLGWAEMIAAVMFLIPQVAIAGGWFLIGVLGFAVVVHVLHGWYDVGALVIYATAVWAVTVVKSQRDRVVGQS